MRQPRNYIRNQFRVNCAHSDGVPEHEVESVELNVEKFVEWVGENYNLKDKITSVFCVGCRLGREVECLELLMPEVDVSGCDVVPEFVEGARQKGLDVVVADAHDLSKFKGKFDAVFTTQAIEHCYNPARAIRQCLQSAKFFGYFSLPLENEERFERNLSHYFHTEKCWKWVKMIEDVEGWHVRSVRFHRKNGVDIAAVNLGGDFEE